MIRAILYLLATVLIISVVRSVIGIIMKGFADLVNPANSTARSSGRPPSVPTGGELKKDPVCGTFIAVGSSLQKRVGDVTYYFCSTDCRDKFR